MTDQPVGRIRFMDEQRVNLDGFAHEDVGLGLVAMASPHDPEPSLVLRDGRVAEMDGRSAEDFDALDALIAAHGIDLSVAEEAMASTTWPSPGSSSTSPSRAPRWSGWCPGPRRPSSPGSSRSSVRPS